MKYKKVSDWKKELSRDFLALGSWVFFVLVLIRILILPTRYIYLTHLIVAGVLILIIEIFVRGKMDYYISRAAVLGLFTSLFYDNNLYTNFVVLVFLGMLGSSYYLKTDLKKTIWGLILGGVVIGVSFLVGNWGV